MIGIAPGHRMVFQLAEFTGEGDVLGLADQLVAQEQHLVRQQRVLDRAEQIVVAIASARSTPTSSAPMCVGEFLDAHQITKIDEPVSPCFEIAMRLHRLVQLVALVDLDLDAAVRDMIEQGVRQLGALRGIAI